MKPAITIDACRGNIRPRRLKVEHKDGKVTEALSTDVFRELTKQRDLEVEVRADWFAINRRCSIPGCKRSVSASTALDALKAGRQPRCRSCWKEAKANPKNQPFCACGVRLPKHMVTRLATAKRSGAAAQCSKCRALPCLLCGHKVVGANGKSYCDQCRSESCDQCKSAFLLNRAQAKARKEGRMYIRRCGPCRTPQRECLDCKSPIGRRAQRCGSCAQAWARQLAPNHA